MAAVASGRLVQQQWRHVHRVLTDASLAWLIRSVDETEHWGRCMPYFNIGHSHCCVLTQRRVYQSDRQTFTHIGHPCYSAIWLTCFEHTKYEQVGNFYFWMCLHFNSHFQVKPLVNISTNQVFVNPDPAIFYGVMLPSWQALMIWCYLIF